MSDSTCIISYLISTPGKEYVSWTSEHYYNFSIKTLSPTVTLIEDSYQNLDMLEIYTYMHVCIFMYKRHLLLGRKVMTNLDIQKQRQYFANTGPSSQSYGFSSSHVGMWELDCEDGFDSCSGKIWASMIAQLVKNLSAMQETLVWFLGWEDLLEKG